MHYSKRLTSLTSHFIFVFVGLAGTLDLFVRWFDRPVLRFGTIGLLLLYLIGGTFGWTWTQRTRRYQIAYYTLMVTSGIIVIITSTWIAQVGISGALIVLPLAMHGAVLSQRSRLVFLSAIMVGLFISILITPPELENLLGFIAALSGVLAFDFVGRVIVSEEAAHEKVARYAREVEDLSIMRERNRLARDIHDNLGHYLTAINMQAQAAQAVLKIDPQQTENALTHIQTLAREGLQEVRRSISAVRTQAMENRSLHEALEALFQEARSRGLTTDFQIIGDPKPNAAEIEITLYRIVQEALTNIHRHAQAQHVTIRLEYGRSSGAVALQIYDDGIGARETDGGFGLLGLRERVHLLGGTFKIRTEVGEGFCIDVEIAP